MGHEHERKTDPEDAKRAMKAALKEWLDEKFAEFGWFSFKTLLAILLGALTLWVLHQNGWQKVAITAVPH